MYWIDRVQDGEMVVGKSATGRKKNYIQTLTLIWTLFYMVRVG